MHFTRAQYFVGRVLRKMSWRIVVAILADEHVATVVRKIVSEPMVYNPPPDLLAVAQPSYARARLLRYGADDPQASVGRYCSLASDSFLFTGGNHHPEHVSTSHFYWTMGAGEPEAGVNHGPIVIDNDVWSGFGSIVMSGVHVGDGAIIATGAIVTKDVPPYAIVGGVPAKIIRYRFDQDVRDALLRIRWWDWTEDKVRAHVAQLESPAVDLFVARHDPNGPGEFCPACSHL